MSGTLDSLISIADADTASRAEDRRKVDFRGSSDVCVWGDVMCCRRTRDRREFLPL